MGVPIPDLKRPQVARHGVMILDVPYYGVMSAIGGESVSTELEE